LLFYQGRWQLLFHPTHAISATPASAGLHYDDVRFAYTETGEPQLAGWWIPAKPGAPYAESTVLYLHGASGSLSDTLPRLKELHSLGINVFAIDYRGFGQSMNVHPSEQSVYADSDDALAYLSDRRRLEPRNIMLYGEGLGATIAAETALRHPQLGGLIMENPVPPALEQIETDPRTRLLPVRLLSTDRFELEPKLQNMKTPKLFLELQSNATDPGLSRRMASLFARASYPKTLAQSNGNDGGRQAPDYLESLSRFLANTFTPQPVHSAVPAATP
jgi:uncharacterized protein